MNKWSIAGKRLICFLLLAVIVIGLLPAVSIVTQAAARGLTMEEMMEKFPHGKYWNGGDFYGNTYRIQGKQYLSVDLKPWKNISRERCTILYHLLRRIPGDIKSV